MLCTARSELLESMATPVVDALHDPRRCCVSRCTAQNPPEPLRNHQVVPVTRGQVLHVLQQTRQSAQITRTTPVFGRTRSRIYSVCRPTQYRELWAKSAWIQASDMVFAQTLQALYTTYHRSTGLWAVSACLYIVYFCATFDTTQHLRVCIQPEC